jgi:hypothetical protein
MRDHEYEPAYFAGCERRWHLCGPGRWKRADVEKHIASIPAGPLVSQGSRVRCALGISAGLAGWDSIQRGIQRAF